MDSGLNSDLLVLFAVNFIAWPIIQMSLAWAGTKAPSHWFNPSAWIYKTFPFEASGKIYETWFLVKIWKPFLPDGASWFKDGFSKRSLSNSDSEYLQRFIVETCRGELVHWAAFLAAGLFFIWNEPWVGWIMVAYAFCANAPCIVVQRYNRLRLRRIASRKPNKKEEEKPDECTA